MSVEVQVVSSQSSKVSQEILVNGNATIVSQPGQTISIARAPQHVAGYVKDEDDLIIKFDDGTELRIQDYFSSPADMRSDIVFVDQAQNQSWRAVLNETTFSPSLSVETVGFHYEPIVAMKTASGVMGWVLPALAVGAAGAGVAAAAGLGGGDSKKDKETADVQQAVVPTPSLGAVNNGVVPINAGDTTNNPRPDISGGGVAPGTTVNIYDNGVLIDTVVADGSGNWTYTPATDLGEGEHGLTFSNVDANGNEGPQSPPFVFDVDTIPPSTAPIVGDALNDNFDTISAGGVTNDARPTINGGGAEPNTVINIYDNGVLIGTVPVDEHGNWVYTPGSDLSEGGHSLTFSNVDRAGNEGPQSPPFDFSVDTIAPTTAPVIGGMNDNVAPVTGAIAAGGTTNDPTPTVNGSGAEPGTSIKIYDNGVLVGTVPVDSSGNWSYTPDSDLGEGNHSLTFSNADNAGNEGPQSAPLNFTLDTTAPVTAPVLGGVTDDVAPGIGTINPGDTTNDVRPTFGGSGAEPGGSVNIYDNGVLIGTAPVDSSGNWTYTPTSDLGEGNHSLTFSNVDAGGNEGPQSTPSFDFGVDTIPPSGTPVIGGVADDIVPFVGNIPSGGTTNDLRPTFSGSGAEANSTVRIYDNGVLVGTVTADGSGDWNYTPATDMAEGTHSFTVRSVDAAGNQSPVSAAYVLTIDTQVPTNAAFIDSITPDTGSSSADFLTSATSLTVHGHLSEALASSATLQISVDSGATWINITPTATSWSYTDPRVLTEGSVEYQTRIISASSVPGVVSSQIVTIDTTGPSMITIDSIADDTGTSATDFITSDTSLTINGSLTAPLVADERAQISLDGGTTWVDLSVAGTSWSHTDGRTLGDGSYSYQIRTIDGAGNITNGAAVNVTVDMTPPGAIAIDSITSDTGDSATDFITSDTSLTINGTLAVALAAGEVAQISVDNGATWQTISNVTGTSWNYADGRVLTDGNYEYQVRVIDAAGNAGPVASQMVTVDIDMPGLLTVVGVIDSIELDTGHIIAGNSTNDASPLMYGSGAEPYSIVRVYDELVSTTVPIGEVYADVTGDWYYIPPSALSDTAYAWSVSNVDSAGNEGNRTAPFNFIVDTALPVDSHISMLAGDSGASATDFIINSGTITLTGTFTAPLNPGETAHISLDGGATWEDITDITGANWTYTDPVTRPDGVYNYEVYVRDAGGNVGASDTRKIVVDTTPPGAISIASISNDSGISAADFITNDTTLTVNGTIAAPLSMSGNNRETAQISIDGGATWTNLSVTGTNWSYNDARTLTDGAHTYHVRIIDLAGNVGPIASQIVTVDTTAPVIPSITAIDSDTGTAGDFITSDNSLTVQGTLLAAPDAGDRVQVSTDGGASWSDAVIAGSSWSFVDGRTLADGSYVYQVRTLDLAGNTTTGTSQTVVVDSSAPTQIAYIDSLSDDTGVSASDYLTSDSTPTMHGHLNMPLDAGNRVEISFDGGTIWHTATVSGTNWNYTSAVLAEGTYLVSVRTIDTAGNVGSLATQNITIDLTAPTTTATITHAVDDVGSITANVLDGGKTDDTRPVLQGTLSNSAVAGEQVRVYLGATLLGTVTLTAGQTAWSYAIASELTDGTQTFTARVVDGAGLEGTASTFSIVIDTTAPATAPVLGSVTDDVAPVTGAIAPGGTTNDQTPTINGSGAEPGGSVKIYDNGVLIGTVPVDGAGNWTYTPSANLGEGSHNLRFSNVDEAGNEGPQSAPFNFTVDTVAPTSVPVLGSMTDDVAPVTGVIPAGGTTNDLRPTLTGSGAEPGGSVKIYDNGVLIGTVVADGSGNWTYTPGSDLSEGAHSLRFSNVDVGGNEGPQSGAFNFTVDTTAPVTVPVLGGVTDDVAPGLGAVSAGGTTNDPRPTVNGSGAEPGGSVNIYDNGVLIGTAPVDSSGNWTYTPSSDLGSGNHSLTFSNVDKGGNEGPQSTPSFDFGVDTTAPATAPVLGSVTDDVAPVTGAITSGGTTNDQTPTMAGSGAEPNTSVNIYDNGVLIGTAPVDGSGNWTYTPASNLGEGNHSLTFSNVDNAGNEGPKSAPFTMIVDTTAPTSAPVLGGVTDDVAPGLGTVSAGGTTNDPRPTVNGSGAEPGGSVNIYDNGVLIGTVPVDSSGNWTYTPSSDLGEGAHSLTFSNVDAGGNEGPQSTPSFNFGVDTIPPSGTPVIGGLMDDAMPSVGNIPSGGTTNDVRPELSGSGAEANSAVHIYDNGVLIGTATADASGDWSFTPSTNLADGAHSFTVYSVDAAGNQSPASAAYTVTIDTQVPTNTALIDSITPDTGSSANDFLTSATSLTVHGHMAQALSSGAKLQISVDGGTNWIDLTPTATSWSYTDPRVLTDGAVQYQTRILGSSGIPGAVTSQTVTIDTTGPAMITGGSIADDTGVSATDFITSDTSLTVNGTLAAPLGVGEIAQISRDGGVTWETITVTGTNWSYTDDRTLNDGNYTYKIRTADAAGNITNGTDVNVTVDTTPPGAIAINSITSDTGDSATDFITSDQTLTINGTLAVALVAGEVVQISIDNGATWQTISNVSGTSWNYADLRTLADGNYEYQVRVIDAAGNAGPVASRVVTVDNDMPGLLIVTRIADSIDPVRTDIVDGTITNDASPVMSGTAAEPNTIVRVYNELVSTTVPIGEVYADASGNWIFAPPAALAEGNYAWSVSNVDAAGNEGNRTAPIGFTVDTQDPANSNIVAVAGDSGASATDFITNNGTITLNGTFSVGINPGETARISVDGGNTWDTITNVVGTNWSYTDPVSRPDGVYYYEVYVEDGAGNVGASDTRKIVVDTTPPGAITIASIDNDSGASTSDFITNDTTLTVSGTIAAPLALGDNKETAQISIDGGATWVNLTVSGTSWSYNDVRTLSDGAHTYQVRIIDLAGNIGPVANQIVTVDTTAPVTASITAIDTDTGTAGDYITTDTSLTLQGTLSAAPDVGDRVQVSTDGGATWGDAVIAGSSWSFVDGRTLADGSYVYQTRTIDLAGNISAGASQTVIVDTSAPTQNIFIDSISDDTGISASDYLTSDDTPTLHGHLSAALGVGDRVEVSFDGGATWNTATATGTNWSYTSAALAEGVYTAQARVTDVAGNIGSVASRSITIDLTAPTTTATITHAVDDVGSITANVLDGGRTDDTKPVLQGTLSNPAVAGEQVRVYLGAALLGTVTLTAGQTTWSYAVASDLANATHNFSARVADAAGLEGPASTFSMTVDTVAPTVAGLAITDLDTDTSWTSAVSMTEDTSDFVTRDTTVRLKGTATVSVGDMVQISSDGGTTWTTVNVVANAWSFDDPTPRTSNTTYQVRVIDDVGNVGATIVSRTVVIDVAAPASSLLAPVLRAADDTGIAGDNVTTDTSLVFSSANSGLKEANSTIALIHDVNGNGIFDRGIDLILATDASAGTSWSLSAAMAAGKSYKLGFVQYDAAGNFSKMSPTSQIDIVSTDNNKTGGFTGTAVGTSWTNEAGGQGVGLDSSGMLLFSVRHAISTQTSSTGLTTENPARPVGDSYVASTILDYNRDGYSDYATSGGNYDDSRQTVYYGNANGTHTGYRQAMGAAAAQGGVIAFDKEGDGYLDLAYGNWRNNSNVVTIANNGGTLLPANLRAPGLTMTTDREISGVDIDNDGDIDLALHTTVVNGSAGAKGLTVLSNDGSGTFSLNQTIDNVFNNDGGRAADAVSMTWADFDGDGDMDLFLGRTNGTNASGIYLNNGGVISSSKINVGDASSIVTGGASIAVDWNNDGKMDIVEFSNPNIAGGVVYLYTNTGGNGTLRFSTAYTSLASGLSRIGGASAVDYDWDGDVDIVYHLAADGAVGSIENTNQVTDGTALHLRILDQNGINSYYGNTVQLFDSAGNLVATQIINPQSGIGTNDSTGIVRFYNLSPAETYTVALLRTVNGASQDIGGVASLTNGASNLSTIENVNQHWTGLKAGAANSSYTLSGESDVANNAGVFNGTGYNDTFFGSAGNDTFNGNGGWSDPVIGTSVWSATGGLDIVDYGSSAGGVTANLTTGTATGQGTDTLVNIEGIRGSAHADILTGSSADNLFEGRGGNDTINLAGGGRDQVVYKMLNSGDATGGNGADTIQNFTVGTLASNNDADVIDLRDLLRNYKGTANVYYDIGTGTHVLDYASRGLLSYLNVTTSGGDTLIQVDLQGTGNFTTVSTLSGVVTTLEALLAGNQLWLASSDGILGNVSVNTRSTTDTTPIVSGTLKYDLGVGEELRIVVNGVTYSSNTPGQVTVDPVNRTWAVEVSSALAAGKYDVSATVWGVNGALLGVDRSTDELTVTSVSAALNVTIQGSTATTYKATALTMGEGGSWRVLSNGRVFDAAGTDHTSLGQYGFTTISISQRVSQSATFMDYNRDGYMDILASDDVWDDGGQQSWTYDGSTYTQFLLGGTGNTSANVLNVYGGVVAYDKVGDGYVDLVYGDTVPNDASSGGGYNTMFTVNNGGTFIKDRNYTFNGSGTPLPTNVNNAGPVKEVSGVDINNDGTVDIVYHASSGVNYTDATRANTSGNIYRLVTVTNNGDGSLYSSQVLDNVFYLYSGDTSYAPSMTWADFNGDGYMDLFLGRGHTNASGAVADSDISRILYNNHGTIVQSTTGTYATTYLGDSVKGGASLALDWNRDGRVDVIELPEYASGASTVNLYINNGNKTFATTSLASIPSSQNITGAVAFDLDWDGDKDLLFTRSNGTNTFIENTSASTYGGSLHVRIVDANGINAFFGNTVQLYNSSGVLVASQIINPQSGMQTNDSSALVDFHGLSANERYSVVMLRDVGGASSDVGGIATAGGNTIENVNSAWTGLRTGEATSGYVLTAESGTNTANSIGPGIVGTGYNDTLFATRGNDVYNGGGGWHDGQWSNTGGMDIIDFKLAGTAAVTVNLGNTGAQATGFNTVTLVNIEGVAGGQGNDTLTGNSGDNTFEGRGGNDTIHLGSGGNDTVLFRLLTGADATGGNGMDTVTGFKVGLYGGTPGADRIDLRELLVGYVGDSDGPARYIANVATIDAGETIGNFIRATVSGADTIISVDRDGTGGTHTFTDIAVLTNVNTNLETLLANHQLVIV